MEHWGFHVLQWCAAVALVLFFLYKYLTKNFDFWERQNVPFVKPRVLLGSFQLGTKPLHELEQELYQKFGRIYGRFDGDTPVLSVADPDILKRIFVKDFQVFQNRRDLKFNDPVMDNTLFILEGEAWKRVRNIVSPTFTSAKMRKMLPLLQECSDVLIQNLVENVHINEAIDCQRLFGAFSMDAIGRCAFGMKIDSLRSEDDPFVAKAKKMLQCFMSWRTVLTVLFPKVMKFFRISLINPETNEFYKRIILELIEKRRNTNVERGDFLQLLQDAECAHTDPNNNTVKDQCKVPCTIEHSSDQITQHSKQLTDKSLYHDELLAQCISFFTAGYEATTSLLSHATYHLAMHPRCQERLLQEIEMALGKNNGKLNYEALGEMKFMDAVLNECLRLCPAVIRLERRAAEDYMMGDTGIVVKRDMLVSIPVYAIHRDPEWYPEPEVFEPDRFFSVDSDRLQYVHLPFGAGPRHCIGMRFVQIEVKMCLANVLKKFRIVPAPNTAVSLGCTEARGVLKVNDVEVNLVERGSD